MRRRSGAEPGRQRRRRAAVRHADHAGARGQRAQRARHVGACARAVAGVVVVLGGRRRRPRGRRLPQRVWQKPAPSQVRPRESPLSRGCRFQFLSQSCRLGRRVLAIRSPVTEFCHTEPRAGIPSCCRVPVARVASAGASLSCLELAGPLEPAGRWARRPSTSPRRSRPRRRRSASSAWCCRCGGPMSVTCRLVELLYAAAERPRRESPPRVFLPCGAGRAHGPVAAGARRPGRRGAAVGRRRASAGAAGRPRRAGAGHAAARPDHQLQGEVAPCGSLRDLDPKECRELGVLGLWCANRR